MEEKTKVLIVDNEPDIVNLLKRFLAEKGYAVSGATGGKDALRMITENPPDILLLDIIMPEIRGTEIARFTRKNNPQTKIIIFTAYPQEGDGLYKENLFDAMLIKPMKLHELNLKLALLTQPAIICRENPYITVKAKLLLVMPTTEIFSFLVSQCSQIILKCQHYELKQAHNDKELFEKLPVFNPDIIVFDAPANSPVDYHLAERIRAAGPGTKEIISFDLTSAAFNYPVLEKFLWTVLEYCRKHTLISAGQPGF